MKKNSISIDVSRNDKNPVSPRSGQSVGKGEGFQNYTLLRRKIKRW